jgi:hypothetical protein
MSHTYSVFRILLTILICLFIVFTSCKDRPDSGKITTDSLTTYTGNIDSNISDSASGKILDKSVTEFATKYNALDGWTVYTEGIKMNAEKELKNRNLVFPLFREQIHNLHQSDNTDTILVYYGNKSNTFVIKITKGESIFDKLNELSNGLMAVKAVSLEYSQKLYLVKKHNEFQHKEKKVTEFYIKAELIDAVNTDIRNKQLMEKFNLEE